MTWVKVLPNIGLTNVMSSTLGTHSTLVKTLPDVSSGSTLVL
jgi:hypothetical protein